MDTTKKIINSKAKHKMLSVVASSNQVSWAPPGPHRSKHPPLKPKPSDELDDISGTPGYQTDNQPKHSTYKAAQNRKQSKALSF